ncbi:hypothetical protein VNO78_12307 [Psophocarpus tetragonolobus]|uniref:Uncharacterized protein n=1 Tax=Psophocarpus tetragonolobus TaxID=3891 RepID=A0AAN9SNW1_PSOTE
MTSNVGALWSIRWAVDLMLGSDLFSVCLSQACGVFHINVEHSLGSKSHLHVYHSLVWFSTALDAVEIMQFFCQSSPTFVHFPHFCDSNMDHTHGKRCDKHNCIGFPTRLWCAALACPHFCGFNHMFVTQAQTNLTHSWDTTQPTRLSAFPHDCVNSAVQNYLPICFPAH